MAASHNQVCFLNDNANELIKDRVLFNLYFYTYYNFAVVVQIVRIILCPVGTQHVFIFADFNWLIEKKNRFHMSLSSYYLAYLHSRVYKFASHF